MSSDPSPDLLARIARGDEAALAELLAAAWRPLVRYVERLTSSPDAAADCAQEAFVRLWERREHWERGSARALLFRIARNVALDQRRRREARRRNQPGLESIPTPRTPADELERQRLVGRCDAALAALPDRRREVFELVRLAGLTHKETAEVLSLSPQTVANTVSLALRDLRDLLADEAPGPRDHASGERPDGATWTN